MTFVPLKAATLAVGTEVTDGQITDRNSSWISQKLVLAGLQVIEHRAVADDRAAIERALCELADRADLLFVTGGLGPTSDDFTRDLISKVFGRPLQYNEESWQHLSQLLASRGMTAHDIQKQQCYFPEGARILKNPAGTANAFAFETKWPHSAETQANSKSVRLYALPGPPTEIAAVWDLNLSEEIESFTPAGEREELFIIRCLGRGESQIAEVTETIIKGSRLRVGYRAHVPYVEVKLWYKASEKPAVAPTVAKLEEALKAWVINHNDEDTADFLIEAAAKAPVHLVDGATFGLLLERVGERMRSRKISSVSLTVESSFSGAGSAPASDKATQLSIRVDEARNLWVLTVKKSGGGPETQLEEIAPFNYKVSSERGRRFITEKALLFFGASLSS
jgi:nicotinamide-nucleotide amidase